MPDDRHISLSEIRNIYYCTSAIADLSWTGNSNWMTWRDEAFSHFYEMGWHDGHAAALKPVPTYDVGRYYKSEPHIIKCVGPNLFQMIGSDTKYSAAAFPEIDPLPIEL